MIEIRRSAIVAYSAQQMFDLVNDVEAYPRRFSWCTGAQLIGRQDDTLTARLELRIAGMNQSFTTRNTLNSPGRIELQLVDGPFRQLSGTWHFLALGERGCKIALELDFEYSGKLVAPLMRSGFQKLADRMVDEFCAEAARIYA
ncbi:MAG: type II toxin-antitoxin system RatA family toxin [Rudaea sp.]